MNATSLVNLSGPDLVIILLIVLLLFGAKKLPIPANDPANEKTGRFTGINRLLVPIAIVIFLLACGVWVFGNAP